MRALLSKGYAVRALTRDVNSTKAMDIKGLGAELVRGNFSDPPSLSKALKGIDGIFAMTTSFEGGVDVEVQQGTNLIEAAQKAGIKHFVMTSVANADQHTGIPHFDSKYMVEEALAMSGMSYTIIAPVSFMDNMLGEMSLAGLKAGRINSFVDVDTPQQSIAVSDIGEMAAAMFARGEEVFGKRVDIASDEVSGTRMAEILSGLTGREIACVQRDSAELSVMPAEFAKMYEWIIRVGYSVDIPALHDQFPEVTWHTFESWAKEQDWEMLLREEETEFI
jgi:uncharacterized protein YbjT (DUF2867 family)